MNRLPFSDKKNLFISESFVGNHANIDFFEADLLSFTFLPNFKAGDIASPEIPHSFRGLWLNGINILKPKERIDIIEEILQSHYSGIIIGTDDDYQGNAMAKLIQLSLIKHGFDENSILRVPLRIDGYNSLGDFWGIETYQAYLQDISEDALFLNKSRAVLGRGGIGRRLACVVDVLCSPPEFVINKNPKGTSMITYLYKRKIDEK